MHNLPIPVQSLVDRFDDSAARCLVLLGSHARGQAGPFSDIDVLRVFAVGSPHAGQNITYLVEDHLIVVTDVDLGRVEQWFTQPELSVLTIAGLRDASALLDRDGTFAAMRDRAMAFAWTSELSDRGERWISRTLVDGIEEVHKALNGLREGGDEYKLLAARHVLTWDLLRIAHVHGRLLPRSDSDAFRCAMEAAGGPDSPWSLALADAFGLGKSSTLRQQTLGGLRLYVRTVERVEPALRDERARALIHRTVARIESALLQ